MMASFTSTSSSNKQPKLVTPNFKSAMVNQPKAKQTPVCGRCKQSHLGQDGLLTKCPMPKPDTNPTPSHESFEEGYVRSKKFFLLGEVKPNTHDGFMNSFTFGVNPMTVAKLTGDPIMIAMARSHKMYEFKEINVKLVPLASNTVVAGTTAQCGFWDDPTTTGPENQNAASRNGEPVQLGSEACFTFKSRNKRQFNLDDQEDQKEVTPGLVFVTLYGKTVSGFTGQQFEGSLFQIWVSLGVRFHVPSDNSVAPDAQVMNADATIQSTPDGVVLVTQTPLGCPGKRVRTRLGFSFRKAIYRISGVVAAGASILPEPWKSIVGVGATFVKWLTSSNGTHTYKIYGSMEDAEEDYQQQSSAFDTLQCKLVGPAEQLTNWEHTRTLVEDVVPPPDDGENAYTEKNLEWEPVPGDTLYEVQLTPFRTNTDDVTAVPSVAVERRGVNLTAKMPGSAAVTEATRWRRGNMVANVASTVLPYLSRASEFPTPGVPEDLRYLVRAFVEVYSIGTTELAPIARWTISRVIDALNRKPEVYSNIYRETGSNSVASMLLNLQTQGIVIPVGAGFLACDFKTPAGQRPCVCLIICADGKLYLQPGSTQSNFSNETMGYLAHGTIRGLHLSLSLGAKPLWSALAEAASDSVRDQQHLKMLAESLKSAPQRAESDAVRKRRLALIKELEELSGDADGDTGERRYFEAGMPEDDDDYQHL